MAKICDRCKKASHGYLWCDLEIIGFFPIFKNYDLCQSCFKKLKAWINDGEKPINNKNTLR
jgi:hypothetical protein